MPNQACTSTPPVAAGPGLLPPNAARTRSAHPAPRDLTTRSFAGAGSFTDSCERRRPENPFRVRERQSANSACQVAPSASSRAQSASIGPYPSSVTGSDGKPNRVVRSHRCAAKAFNGEDPWIQGCPRPHPHRQAASEHPCAPTSSPACAPPPPDRTYIRLQLIPSTPAGKQHSLNSNRSHPRFHTEQQFHMHDLG
ncbi:hypothetical protein ABH922_004831 [Rhodococcus sp. 27YEA15]